MVKLLPVAHKPYEEICGHLIYTLFTAKMKAGTSMSNTFLLKNYKK